MVCCIHIYILIFYLAKEEIKEERLEALPANMNVLQAALDVGQVFEKGSLTDLTVWNTGEADGINTEPGST